jgi:sarcosine oxidase / L-pipecolate oxidase
MPVVADMKWNLDYFPPFRENGIMKIAALGSGYRVNGGPRTQSDHPSEEGIPKEAEEHLRRKMRQVIPALAEKELFDVRVCWCVDTPDANFLITPHPEIAGLYLATGGINFDCDCLFRFCAWVQVFAEDRTLYCIDVEGEITT